MISLLQKLGFLGNGNRSVYFVTFHKTASSFFAGYVLKKVQDLIHVDPAHDIFIGMTQDVPALKRYDHIYGPVRLSLDEGPIYEKFVAPLLEKKVLYKNRVLCFIRDPRDIIVSFFYSQAYSHVLSKNDNIRKLQLKNREEALEIGIDRYAVKKAYFLKEKFAILQDICLKNDDLLLLKYEDLINDFDRFYQGLSGFVELPGSSREEIYKRTRPRGGGIHSHRRNGASGGYRSDLKEETVDDVNRILGPVLEFFSYESCTK